MALSRSEQSYCITHKEMLAVVEDWKHFKPYLIACSFLLRTDHDLLRWVKEMEGQVDR